LIVFVLSFQSRLRFWPAKLTTISTGIAADRGLHTVHVTRKLKISTFFDCTQAFFTSNKPHKTFLPTE